MSFNFTGVDQSSFNNKRSTRRTSPSQEEDTSMDIEEPNLTIEEHIQRLTSQEVLDVFCSAAHFSKLMDNSHQYPEGINLYFWKLAGVLGEIFLKAQSMLISQGEMQYSVELQIAQVHYLTTLIIDKVRGGKQNGQIDKMKECLVGFIKAQKPNKQTVIEVYERYLQMGSEPVKIHMELSYPPYRPDPPKQPTKEMNPPKPPLHHPVIPNQPGPAANQGAARMAQSTAAFNPQKVKKTQQAMDQPAINGKQPVQRPSNPGKKTVGRPPHNANPVFTQSVVGSKQPKKKWQASQESTFCTIYSENEDSVSCHKALQSKLGIDGRWATTEQIDSKMQILATKVFNKFEALNTTNQHINKFRSNRSMVLSGDGRVLRHVARRQIYRHIAIIYKCMLDVNEKVKPIISQKIIQINELVSNNLPPK